MKSAARSAKTRSKVSSKRSSGALKVTPTPAAPPRRQPSPLTAKLLRLTGAQRTATVRFLATLAGSEWDDLRRWVEKVHADAHGQPVSADVVISTPVPSLMVVLVGQTDPALDGPYELVRPKWSKKLLRSSKRKGDCK